MTSDSSIRFAALAFLLGVIFGSDSYAAEEDTIAARNKAIQEADQKAFKANMAAYEKDVRPFLEKHCIACHGPKALEADLSLDLLDPDMKESTSGARWAVVLSLIHI